MKRLFKVFLLLFSLCLAACPMLATDLNGAWDFVVYADDGPRQFPATFQVNGVDISGKWGGFEAKGTFVDGKLELEFPIKVEDVGMEGNIRLTGTVQGDSITGKWEFEGYWGTFEASRANVADKAG